MKIDTILEKYRMLAAARPLPPGTVNNLDAWFRVELTYSSNAIEGNTLTRAETAVVLEKGITVSGKPLKDHLEATNHAEALDWIQTLIRKKPKDITASTIMEIHRLVLKSIEPDAGIYRRLPVRIQGSAVIMPNAAKVPKLMDEFIAWLHGPPKMHPVQLAAEAHYRLVSIHPFSDGNGRTARLLMNLILLQSGYPPAIIRPRDRLAYISSLEKAQLGGPIDDYERVFAKAVERSLDIYLKAIRNDELPQPSASINRGLLKIGELAKRAGLPVATIRFWQKEGLIKSTYRTESGYAMFAPDMIERIKMIQRLQDQRYSLAEIREKIIDME